MTSWTLALLLSRRRLLSADDAPLRLLEIAERLGWCERERQAFLALPLVDDVAASVRAHLQPFYLKRRGAAA